MSPEIRQHTLLPLKESPRRQMKLCRLGALPFQFMGAIRALNGLEADPRFLEREDTCVEIGGTANMVESTKGWLLATQLINDLPGSGGFALTPLASHIFGKDGLDPYLEEDETVWLIHWNLVSRPRVPTIPHLVFNRNSLFKHFTESDLIDAIRQRLASLNFKAPAASTLKTEVRTFMRTYADSLNYRRGEDHDLGVVLPRLSLITQIGSEEEKNFDEDTYALLRSGDVPACVLAYAILDYMRNQRRTEIPIPELFYSGAIPFRNVFPGSENDLFLTLEKLVEEHPHVFAIRKSGSDMFLYIMDRPTSILEVLSY